MLLGVLRNKMMDRRNRRKHGVRTACPEKAAPFLSLIRQERTDNEV